MKLKKVAALGMAALMAASLGACGGSGGSKGVQAVIPNLLLFGLKRFSAMMQIPLWKKESKALRKKMT